MTDIISTLEPLGRVADPDTNPDQDLFCRIRIRKIFTDPDPYPHPDPIGTLAMYSCINKEKYFKNRGFTHFQVNFSIFSDKNNHHSMIQILEEICLMCQKILMFELIL